LTVAGVFFLGSVIIVEGDRILEEDGPLFTAGGLDEVPF